MTTVTHREMRNHSGEILRRVAAGESVQVTNNGQVAALIVPPSSTSLDALVERGQARAAVRGVEALRTIRRRRSSLSSAQLVADSRGTW